MKERLIAVLMLLSLIITCSIDKSTEEIDSIIGVYKYNYPSGEVEMLIIIDDSTYIKNIYSNEQQYRNSKVFYTNHGKWRVDDNANTRRGLVRLVLYDWLSYNKLRNPQIVLNTPYKVTMQDVYWVKPAKGNYGSISLDLESGYIFTKRSSIIQSDSLSGI